MNLTVSDVIDAFLQAGNQAGMQSAIGLIPGVAPGGIVQLDDENRLPNVDGSQLTDIAGTFPYHVAGPNSDLVFNLAVDVDAFYIDAYNQPQLQGNEGTLLPQDRIGFDPYGNASVFRNADGIYLPIARQSGFGSSVVGGMAPLTWTSVTVVVTGAQENDSAIVGIQNPGASDGGMIVAGASVNGPGTVYINFFNSSPTTSVGSAGFTIQTLRPFS